MNRQMHLGAIIQGASGNMSAWRHPDAVADASINVQFCQQLAQKAEQGKFEMALLFAGERHPHLMTLSIGLCRCCRRAACTAKRMPEQPCARILGWRSRKISLPWRSVKGYSERAAR